jgi:hypothetical protein
MAENADPAHGEAGLTVSPWALRGAVPALGRTPALRGFPGGIGMAGPGWPGGLAEEDQAAHGAWPGAADETAALAGSGAGPDRGVNGAGRSLPGLAQPPGRGNGARRGGVARDGRPAGAGEPRMGRRHRPGRVPAGGRGTVAGDHGRSVWQRALSAWREAGLEWQSAASWAAADVDLQRTEPIPVVPAADVPPVATGPAPEQPPGPGSGPGADSPDLGPEAGPAEQAPHTGIGPEIAAGTPAESAPEETGLGDVELAAGAAVLGAAVTGSEAAAQPAAAAAQPAVGEAKPEPAAVAPESAGEVPQPGAGGPELAEVDQPGAAGAEPGGEVPQPGTAEPEPGGGVLEPETAGAGNGSVDIAAAGGAPGRTAGRDGTPAVAAGPQPAVPGRSRASRGVLVGVVICVAVIALAIAGIVITGPGGGQSAGLSVTSQSAVPADAQFAGPGGAPPPAMPPALTGIAAVGSTLVAIGAQGTLPAARPLVLTSADGGQTWQRAVLRVPGGGTAGAGAVPLLVAGGPGKWLALAADATWTSADGRAWRLGPAIAPVAAGDRVRALAATAAGFLAVGENVHLQGGVVTRSPVLWRTSDGLTWQREGAAQARLPAGKGRALALYWVAASGSTVMIGGNVAQPGTRREGKRLVRVTTQSVMVWLTTDGGRTWAEADPPFSNGATAGLAGLAATGSGLVAIRPGRTASGVPDAVVYLATRRGGWQYAGQLRARHRGRLVITGLAGSSNGVAVTGLAGPHRVAFVSVNGRSWRQTADLATSPAMTVTGLTAGPRGSVLAAGAGPQPFLLLARARWVPVGQAALAGAAAAGVSVNGLGISQDDEIAVGQAGLAPAIWLHPAGGQWTQVTAPIPTSWQGRGPGLTGVVHGNAGWLAVGTEGGPGSAGTLGSTGLLATHAVGGGQHPVMLTSVDGRNWQAQPGPGPISAPTLTLTGAAAGPSGYVVVGLQNIGGQPVPALFWSADLRSWRPQGWWTGYAPAGQPVSAPLAVAAGRAGFAAVGATGDRPAVWLSRAGQNWLMRPLALPPGARGAVLQQVAFQGSRIVALGTEARGSGPVPFAAVSANGGRTWREYPLPGSTHPATVTALAPAGSGFAAAGTVTSASGQDVIVWWSADGQNWQVVQPAGRGLGGPGGHAITGLAGLQGQVTGVGYAATPTGQHPILWYARAG